MISHMLFQLYIHRPTIQLPVPFPQDDELYFLSYFITTEKLHISPYRPTHSENQKTPFLRGQEEHFLWYNLRANFQMYRKLRELNLSLSGILLLVSLVPIQCKLSTVQTKHSHRVSLNLFGLSAFSIIL